MQEKKEIKSAGQSFPHKIKDEAEQFLYKIQSNYPKASHNPYAYRIQTSNGMLEIYDDDGEPSGTSGKPIYIMMESNTVLWRHQSW